MSLREQALDAYQQSTISYRLARREELLNALHSIGVLDPIDFEWNAKTWYMTAVVDDLRFILSSGRLLLVQQNDNALWEAVEIKDLAGLGQAIQESSPYHVEFITAVSSDKPNRDYIFNLALGR